MKSWILKNAENYPSHILFQESNSFGDQILKVRHEHLDGTQEYIWTELNHEGHWREVTQEFIESLTGILKLKEQ